MKYTKEERLEIGRRIYEKKGWKLEDEYTKEKSADIRLQ